MSSRLPDRAESVTGQRGAALLLFLLLIGVGALAVFVTGLNRATQQLERDRITNEALAQAKAALIGYAASRDLSGSSKRPGDLPCPDNHPIGDPLEGSPSTPCNSNALGRLPWKKLGLPDLRDSSGERLWYAVSVNFKDSTATPCNPSTGVGCLNSDTNGTITVRNHNGDFVNNGTDGTAAIAVVIAPGAALTREDGFVQARGPGEYGVAKNYLDIGGGEDNANFVDNDINGFIQGDIRNVAMNIILNDHLITISPSDLMPVLEKRVLGEVQICLTEYAIETSPFNNQGRYPWAVSLSAFPSYSDSSNVRFGRIPDTPFGNTQTDSGTLHKMDDHWTGNCNIVSNSGWWPNWKEMVFYAVADAFKPVNLDAPPVPAPGCGLTGTCLTVNPPSASANKQVVVLVAGRRLSGQTRSINAYKVVISNYLEDQNATPVDDIFERSSTTSTFNDAAVYAP